MAALQYSVSARGRSTRPGLGNGAELAQSLKFMRNKDALKVFNVLREYEAWDVLAFRETWTEMDTEELRLLDGGAGIFTESGPLETSTFVERLPSIFDLMELLTKKHIAIVGSGHTLTGHGREIDEHPVVARFNHLVGPRLNEKDTGKKTQIHVINVHIKNELGPDVLVIDFEADVTWQTYCRKFNVRTDVYKTRFTTFRPTARCAMFHLREWTRGFLFYWFVGSLFEKVDMYGMGSQDGSGHYGGRGRVYEPYLKFEHVLYSEASKLRGPENMKVHDNKG